MRKLLLFCLLLPSIVLAQFSVQESYFPAVFTNSLNEPLPYRVYKNPHPKKKPIPLIVMLHGSGECGTNNMSQLNTAIPAFQKTWVAYHFEEPMMIIAPQCTPRSAWVRNLAFQAEYKLPRYAAPRLRDVKELCDELIKKGEIDEDRISIMGYSLGGFGVWDAIERWPNYFAAAVPICGGGSIQKEALDNAKTTSIWVFHGAKDASVPVTCSQRIVNTLIADKYEIRYTEFSETGHAIWNRVYGDVDVHRWILKQRRGKPPKEKRTGFWNDFLNHFIPD